MTDDNHNRPDILESAIDAVRREPIPPGPPPELAAATIRLLQTTTEPPEIVRRQERKARMIRIAQYSSVSTVAAVLAAFLGWFAFSSGPSSVAFADVVQNVQKAESVTMTNSQKIGNQPEFEFRISIRKNHFRMAMSDTFALIADIKKKQALQLDHGNKIAYRIPVTDEMAKRFANPIDQFRKLQPKDAKRRGDERIDGKTVHVYIVRKIDFLGFKGKGEMKIWVDPKTKLPLKIRIGVNARSGSKATDRPFDTVMIYKDFQWNKKLDPKLFELKVPEGYKVKQGAPGPNRGK